MNYNSFLINNNNKKCRLSTHKRNSKKFLLSASAVMLLCTGLVVFAMKSNNPPLLQQLADNPSRQQEQHNFGLSLIKSDTDLSENTSPYVSSIDLPEIGYKPLILQSERNNELSTSITEATSLLVSEAPATANGLSQSLIPLHANSKPANIELADTVSVRARQDMPESDETITEGIEKALQSSISPALEKVITIKRGDTLSEIFKDLSISSKTLNKILKSGPEVKQLIKIKPDEKIAFTLDSNKQLTGLRYPINKIDTLVIRRQEQSYIAQITSKETETRQQFASGVINASLFAAGNQAGLSSAMIMKLARLFGWDIDFALDIRKGDSFSLVYEEKYVDDKKIAEGDILAAEFVNQGKNFYAVRYTDASGRTDYYSDKGYSMRKAFLRTPVEFSRISSRFSARRKHPVLNRIRAHKGVDYAASKGTPVKAAGNGKVIFKGRKGGYGRVLILQHGSEYTTLYAHLNAYNKKIKKGSRVKQGQIIAYVGSSGLATGPHLHYEFRVNGVHRNPLTVPLPNAAPLAKKYRPDFELTAENMISQLKSQKQSTLALKAE